MEPIAPIDLDQLLKLRLVVARIGEMDLAKWWNTKGQLGGLGSAALQRGFPRTHHFAQARSVFAVAAHRCSEISNPPRSVTLWQLPESVEQGFDQQWEEWLDSAADWRPFFQQLESISSPDLIAALQHLELVRAKDLASYARLRRAAEGRAVPVPGVFRGGQEEVTLLALGFGRGEVGALAVPFAQRAE